MFATLLQANTKVRLAAVLLARQAESIPIFGCTQSVLPQSFYGCLRSVGRFEGAQLAAPDTTTGIGELRNGAN